MARLGDIVDDVRRREFVGRREAVRCFDDALAGRSERRVLFVHGPGGIGKTTLLMHLRSQARRARRPVGFLDGREVEPSPEGFVQAAGGHTALLVDGYEHLGAIDEWMRRELIPSLPADGLLVLAGRDRPARAWRSDPGWRAVVAIHALGTFDDEESARLVDAAGVPEPDRARVLALGQGHPLALALLADAARAGRVPRSLAEAPDLITALVETVVRDAPSEAHLTGLATCARSWLTTEDLLRRTVGPAAGAVWGWLRDRPFVVVTPNGLMPHDLTRDVLDAEFERRSPDRYRELHRIIHDHAVAGVRAATGPDRQLCAQRLLRLHRHSPVNARLPGEGVVGPARPQDRVAEMITDATAREWLAEPGAEVTVVRTARGVTGVCVRLLCPTGSALEERDPLVRAILGHVERDGPARPGELVEVGRYVAGDDAVLAGSVSSLIDWFTRPLAWSLLAVDDPALWGPYFDYLAFRHVLDVTAGGVRYAVYGTDWRRFPVGAWLDLMNEREQRGGSGPPPEELLRPAPLGRAAFAAAVRAALTRLQRPDGLAGSPLVGSALGADPGAVRAAILAAIGDPGADPRNEPLLRRTYLVPAATQEAAAEVLGLPFSTYRRHLAKAVGELTDRLWRREVGGE